MTKEQMAAAFNEWMERYTKEPEKFNREWQSITEFLGEKGAGQIPSYGERCAEYMTRLAGELSK